MRIAVIDLGTNTFNLLIADITDNKSFKKVFNEKIPSRLGMGGINDGLLTSEAFNRGKEALTIQKQIIDEHEVEKIFAFATSAIRNAKNGIEFCDYVKEHIGIDINIINGQEEAELIYWGNQYAIEFNNEPYVIMDIGGGSNEFIIANKDEIFWKHSFELGVTRLLNKFNPSDPITKDEIVAVETYLINNLQLLFEQLQKFNVRTLVGSSGSFDTFRDILGGELNHCKTQKSFNLHLKEFYKLYDILVFSSTDNLKKIKGMDLARVDLISLACVLVNCVLKNSKIETIIQSSYSLKEGVIFKKFIKP